MSENSKLLYDKDALRIFINKLLKDKDKSIRVIDDYFNVINSNSSVPINKEHMFSCIICGTYISNGPRCKQCQCCD